MHRQQEEKPQKSVQTFLQDEDGSGYVFTAIGLVMMLAFVGVALDMGNWYYQRRQMQVAVDAAAMAAALELARDGATTADAIARGKAIATANGYTAGTYVNVVVRTPPQSGPYQSDPAYVEAVITQDTAGFINTAIRSGNTNIGARAVATTRLIDSCIYALDPSASGAITVRGNADVTLDCGALANSTSGSAISQSGSACFTASSFGVVGGISESGCLNGDQQTGLSPATDPFAYLSPPSAGFCDHPALVALNSSFSGTIDHAVEDVDGDGYVNYCGGLRISGADVIFDPGIYVMDGIGLRIQGNADVSGTDVTFYFPSTTTGQSGHFLFVAGSAAVDLSATIIGPYQGILFYANPSIDPSLTVDMLGGADQALTGVIYVPNSHVNWSGNNTLAGAEWSMLIARTIEFSGSSAISAHAAPAGSAPLALSQPSLAE